MIGKTISHYKILEKLGEGGMGVVYKAEDTKLKRMVALKFLSPQIVGGEEEKKRFVHEAQAAAALHHSNICTIHEIDEADGHIFIVMAYLEGDSIKEKIAARPLKLDDAVEIAMQVAQGLQEAHDKGVVHRDIKSSNVMLTTKGQAILMDFGLARQAGRTVVTKEGTTLGTIAYMSPEQAQGAHVDHRTDIWSFGIMLYEMVAGQFPFAGDYEQAVIYSIMNEEPEPLTAVRTGVPMALERLVNKALAKDPVERYQNINDMLIDLRSVAKEIESGATRTGERPLAASTTELERAASGSFLQNLLARRVPQILGLYFAASWGIIQFVEWLVRRYQVSPHLPDFSFVILVSLIPTVYLLAYFHGRPGPDRWTQFEKIGIPLNLLAAAVLLFFVFQGKDLGAASKTVTVQDEQGNQIERVIPKSQFRKKVVLFSFDNKSEDLDLDWLQYAFPFMIGYDLLQDMFLDIRNVHDSGYTPGDYYIYHKIRDAGFPKATGVPLALKRKITNELHLPYFASGTFKKADGNYSVEISLYETKNSKLVKKREFTGADIFVLADEISLQLKKDLELPAKHIQETNDLPVVELLTNSVSAFQSQIEGLVAMVFEKDWARAQAQYELAIKEDPTFAAAYTELIGIYILSNQTEKRVEIFQPLMQHLYKLPERTQYLVKAGYYDSKQQPEKQLAVVKMLVELYPDYVKGHYVLALFYGIRNQRDEQLAEYKKILELDPERYETLRTLGNLYQAKGEFNEALKYFNQYAAKFPEDPKSFTSIGALYREMGNYKQAKANYDKALLLDAQSISVQLTLADIDADLGNFEQAFDKYQEVLTASSSPQDKMKTYHALEKYYVNQGQIKKSVEYMELKMAEMEKFSPPLMVLFRRISTLDSYVMAGQEDVAFQTAKKLESEMQPPYNMLASLGYMTIYLELEDADKTEEALKGVKKAIEALKWEVYRYLVFFAQGNIHEFRGEYEEAILSFQKQLELGPTNISTYRFMGRCYRKLKEYDDAEEYLQKLLKIHPFGPLTNYELAELYSDMGETERAIQYLQTALEVWKNADPEYKPAKLAREKLVELQS